MRAVAIGILALGMVGCAPAGTFDVAPRATSASSQVGAGWIETESTQATVSAAFERSWLDHLLFEVRVVNRSDSTLVVDPGEFSLTIVGSTGDPPRELAQHLVPESSGRVLARLQREAAVGTGLSDAVLGLAGLALATVVVTAIVMSGELPEWEPTDAEPLPDVQRSRRVEAVRERDRLQGTLLHRTELAPGQSAQGALWFAAGPLRKVIGPRQPSLSDGAWRITASTRRDVECALTLRAPAALGGQEIDYFVWSE